MPYKSNDDLPEQVKNNLPDHAQDIYREAFNSASEEYRDPDKRRGDDDAETVSHKVAWAAVKNEYEKGEDGKWRKR